MKYAICNETFGDWNLADALDLAKDTGYTGWEVAPFMLGDDIFRFDSSSRNAYRDQVEKAGFEVIGLHWLLAKTEGYHLTTEDNAVRESTANYLASLAELCSDLGGGLMVLGSPQQRNVPEEQSMESAMDNAVEVLRRVTPQLEKHNVKIAVEPLGKEEGNFLNHACDARQIIERVDHPNVRLHLDVKAMSDEGTPIDKIIQDNADLMIHFHANDPNKQGPGMGDVDFVPILRMLEKINYQGWTSVEVFDYSPGIETLVVKSMENLLTSLKATQ